MATKIRVKKEEPKKKSDKELISEGVSRRASMTSEEKSKGEKTSKEIEEFLKLPGTGSKGGFSDSEKEMREQQIKAKGYTQDELKARVSRALEQTSKRMADDKRK